METDRESVKRIMLATGIECSYPKGNLNQNGLYDLDRKPHPAAKALGELCGRYGKQPLVENFQSTALVGASVLDEQFSNGKEEHTASTAG